jgi:hypothetical protein
MIEIQGHSKSRLRASRFQIRRSTFGRDFSPYECYIKSSGER